jgi:hypothetical protein
MLVSLVKRAADRVRSYLLAPLFAARLPEASMSHCAASQIALLMAYRDRLRTGAPLPRLQEVGFKVFSQVDEDGILLFLFAIIGTTNKQCVEICAGDGIECNTANLIVNHFWHGLLIDADEHNIQRGQAFYASSPAYVFPPQLVHAWITRENINDLIRANGISGEIDLLSLDMDGIDYWAWEALTVINPRVVVLEFQCAVGPDRAVTVPYHERFTNRDFGCVHFAGGSLAAFIKLGKRKGYRFIGCNSYGFNAFFIRNGIADDILPETSPADWFQHPKVIREMTTLGPELSTMPWIDV